MTHCLHRMAVGASALILMTAVALGTAHQAHANDIVDALKAF